MKMIFFPYKLGSQGCKELAKALSCKRVRANGTFKPTPKHLVVNWGNSVSPKWTNPDTKWLNKPEAVANATNKLKAFKLLEGKVSIPPWTTDVKKAQEWINSGLEVVSRHYLSASGGRGITLCGDGHDGRASARLPVSDPLFVAYVKKKAEYRVAVAHGEVIDVTQKKHPQGSKDHDSKIRSHDRGWIFARDGVEAPAQVTSLAVDAVKILGLDFGAVDVIYNGKQDKAYVLEVNTAPGLEGTSVEKYAVAFRRLL